MKISIAPDFQDLLPPLSVAERKQLEESCLSDPRHERMPKIIVWGNHNNTIIDGHNQHEIRVRHGLTIRYAVIEFDDRGDALKHALDVQFGRRNLDPSQRAIAYARLPRFAHGGDRKSADQEANLPLDALAKSAGVSKRTMQSAMKIADHGAPDVIHAVRAGNFSASDAATIADLPKQQQAELAAVAKRNGSTLKAASIDDDFSVDRVERENSPARKHTKNGSSVDPGKERKIVLKSLGIVIRGLHTLGLFDEFNECLSQIRKRVRELK